MKKRASDFDNSKSQNPQSDAPFRRPVLTLGGPAAPSGRKLQSPADPSPTAAVPAAAPPVARSFDSDSEPVALSEFDFSTPPWLIAEIQDALDVDGVIPLDALEKLSSYWLMDRRHSRGRLARTLESYQEVLEKLVWFIRQRRKTSCGETELHEFFEYCRIGHTLPGGRWGNPHQTQPLSERSRNLYYANLRAFFRWAVKIGYLTKSLLDRISVPRYKKNLVLPFTEEQVGALLQATKSSVMPLRDLAIGLFLWDTGVRAEETATALWNYLRSDKRKKTGVLFMSQRGSNAGHPLTPRGLHLLFVRLGKMAGITGVRCSPHTMRYTYASHALMKGASADEVRRQLGHTTLHMTNQYVDLTDKYKRERHNSYSPVSKFMMESNVVRGRRRPRKR